MRERPDYLGLVPDAADAEADELDAIALRDVDPDEGPRPELGHRAAPTRPEPSPVAPVRLLFCDGGGRDCPGYRTGMMLFQRPGGGGPRCWCAACVGRVNRRTIDATRDCVRALKSATATGHAEEERSRFHELVGLVGKAQADETAKAILAALDEKPARSRRGER